MSTSGRGGREKEGGAGRGLDVSRDLIRLDSFVSDSVLQHGEQSVLRTCVEYGMSARAHNNGEERVILDLSSRFQEEVQLASSLDTLQLLSVEHFLLENVERLRRNRQRDVEQCEIADSLCRFVQTLQHIDDFDHPSTT